MSVHLDAEPAVDFVVRAATQARPATPAGVARRRAELGAARHIVARDGTPVAVGSAVTWGAGDAAVTHAGVASSAAVDAYASTALVAATLLHAEAARTVVDADPLGPFVATLTARGLMPAGTVHAWRRDAAPRPPREAGVGLYPFSACELMEIVAFDAPRFGAGRGAWLAAALAADEDRAFVAFAKDGGAVAGIALAHEDGIGPVVADDARVAAQLLFACVRAGAPARVLAPDTPSAEAALKEAGFTNAGPAWTRYAPAGAAAPPAVVGVAGFGLG